MASGDVILTLSGLRTAGVQESSDKTDVQLKKTQSGTNILEVDLAVTVGYLTNFMTGESPIDFGKSYTVTVTED